MLPLPDNRDSQKSFFPNSSLAGVFGLSFGMDGGGSVASGGTASATVLLVDWAKARDALKASMAAIVKFLWSVMVGSRSVFAKIAASLQIRQWRLLDRDRIA